MEQVEEASSLVALEGKWRVVMAACMEDLAEVVVVVAAGVAVVEEVIPEVTEAL